MFKKKKKKKYSIVILIKAISDIEKITKGIDDVHFIITESFYYLNRKKKVWNWFSGGEWGAAHKEHTVNKRKRKEEN